MQDIVKNTYRKGVRTIFPANQIVQNWAFPDTDEDEATLCHHIAVVAEKNGLTANDLHQIFPAILRMLRSDSVWANQKSKT